MKILFYLHHPAHFHLFKNIIKKVKQNHEVILLATKKDILENLLQNEGFDYINVLPDGRKDNKYSIAIGLLKQDFRLLKICLQRKPNILVGTSTEITHIGKLLNIPSLFINEDDVEIIPLVGKIAYPFARHLIVPNVCSTGKWKAKTIHYNGYHELSYLHPNHFEPKMSIVEKIVDVSKPFYVLRFAKLGAHHDSGIRGINKTITLKLIEILESSGNILITSERELEPEFEKYRINVNPLLIHHVIAFATLYIGDSQTMAAEAGVLGTPFIRFNDFVGRIGYLNDLEELYKLGYGIKPDNPEKLYEKVEELISTSDLKQVFSNRRQIMLSEKIDYAAFLVWFIENYPQSVEIMKSNPDYQYNFK